MWHLRRQLYRYGTHSIRLSTKGWTRERRARFRAVFRISKPGHVDTLVEVRLRAR